MGEGSTSVPARRTAGAPSGAGYRGEDRRGLVVADRAPAVGMAVAPIAVVAVVLAWAALRVPGGSVGSQMLTAQLQGAGVAVALTAAILYLVRWRVVGEAAALYLSAASLTFAVTVLLPGAASLASASELEPSILPASGRLVAAVLVVIAVVAPQVDTRARPHRVYPAAALGVVVAALALSQFPAVPAALLMPSELVGAGVTDPSATPTVALLWVGVGSYAIVVGLRRRQPLLAWFGSGLLLLAAAQVATLLPGFPVAASALAAACLQVAGVVTFAVGGGSELLRAIRAQDGRLLATVSKVREVSAQVEADVVAREERAHEARNILLSIEASASTLERFRDQLASEDRQELADAISRGVERLQRLVDPTPELEAITRFHPAEVVAPLATAMRSQDVEVHLDVPTHLVATGRPLATAQVLHNLLENARRHGRSPVWVRAHLDGDRLVVAVTDAGQGIEPDEQEAIFARGTRGAATMEVPGSGLGLHIARELMRAQEGDLRLAPRAGVGATFELVLPGASTLLSEQGGHQDEELRQPSGARQFLRLVLGTSTPADLAHQVDDHDGIDDAAAR